MNEPPEEPDPYAATGPRIPVPSGPPPESGWHYRRRVLREDLPSWLGVLAIAFVIGMAASVALIYSPSARRDVTGAVHPGHSRSRYYYPCEPFPGSLAKESRKATRRPPAVPTDLLQPVIAGASAFMQLPGHVTAG